MKKFIMGTFVPKTQAQTYIYKTFVPKETMNAEIRKQGYTISNGKIYENENKTHHIGYYNKVNEALYTNNRMNFLFSDVTISSKDLSSFKALCEKADPIEMLDAIENSIESDNSRGVSSIKMTCLEFFSHIEGFIMAAKTLHWNADTMAEHKLIEDVYTSLEKLEDSIAEDMMGFLGIRITQGELTATPVEVQSIAEYLMALQAVVDDFYNMVNDDKNCIGIVSELESFIHELNKYKYLNNLK